MADVADKFGIGASKTYPFGSVEPSANSIVPAICPPFDVSLGGTSTAADLLYAQAFIPAYDMNVDGLVFENTSATGNVRMGLYEAGSDGLPGSLLQETASTSISTTDVHVIAISSQAVSKDTKYYITWVADGNIPLLTYSAPMLFRGDGIDVWSSGNTIGTGGTVTLYKNHTFGALPDPFGTPTAGSPTKPIFGARKV